MFCNNCGKEIGDNSKFCQYCGEKFSDKDVPINSKDEGSGKLNASIIGGVVFLAILMFSFNDNLTSYQSITSTNEGKGTNLTVTESHSCNLGYGARAICGTVKNNSNHNAGYVQVEINLYDKKGNLIDSTLDNVNNLEPYATWKFQAPIINDNVATYKIKNVVGY